MNQKTWIWFQREIINWTSKGLITKEAAETILASYGDIKENKDPSLLRIIVILIGISLVGMGIFLLFAGYWYSFSPNGRFDWALVLTMVASLLVAGTLWLTEKGHVAREIVGIAYFLAIVSAISLVGDTYYLGRNNGLFLLLGSVLSLPIAYILASHGLMILYLLGVSLWSMTDHAASSFLGTFSIWPLIVVTIPYCYRTMLDPTNHPRLKSMVVWAFMVAVYAGIFFNFYHYEGASAILSITVISVLTFAVGKLISLNNLWTLPFRTIGMLGLLYIIFKGTLVGTWIDIATLPSISFLQWGLGSLFLVASGYATVALWKEKLFISTGVSLISFVVASCIMLARIGLQPLVLTVLFNIFIFLIVLISVIRATTIREISLVNSSILAVLVMVVARFFDPTFTFVARGISFLLVGVLLILVNIIYMWNKRRKIEVLKSRWQEVKEQTDIMEDGNDTMDEE